MSESLHPAASDAPPSFITPPGETDVLMVVMAVILVLAVLTFGIIYFRLHSLPERMAHRSQKIQFEIVAVLGLISLFTHMHIFWIAGLLLALIELPDFGTPLSRIAGSVERIAGTPPGESTAGPHGTGSIVTEANEVTGALPKTYEVSKADKIATLPTTTRQPKRS